MRRIVAVLAVLAVCAAVEAPLLGADAVFTDGYDEWYFGAIHMTASEVDTLDPSFTPSYVWIGADSCDVRLQLYPASADTALQPWSNVFTIDDGEGIVLPFRVDYIKVTEENGDAGRVRFIFGGHSD
jgi:hypothetical protein